MSTELERGASVCAVCDGDDIVSEMLGAGPLDTELERADLDAAMDRKGERNRDVA